MFKCPFHFPFVFLLLQRLSLVKKFLTLTKCYIHLGTSVRVNEDECGHNGVASLFSCRSQSLYLPLGK
jgi:hypothetical protein